MLLPEVRSKGVASPTPSSRFARGGVARLGENGLDLGTRDRSFDIDLSVPEVGIDHRTLWTDWIACVTLRAQPKQVMFSIWNCMCVSSACLAGRDVGARSIGGSREVSQTFSRRRLARDFAASGFERPCT